MRKLIPVALVCAVLLAGCGSSGDTGGNARPPGRADGHHGSYNDGQADHHQADGHDRQ